MSSEDAAKECARIANDNTSDVQSCEPDLFLSVIRSIRLAALEEAEAAVKARMEIERVTDAYGYDRERNNEREYIIDCIRALKGESNA